MTADRLLSVMRADGAALADAAAKDLDAPIPSCPGWSMSRLVTHTGQVHQWAAEMVRTQSPTRIDRKTLAPPPQGAAVVDWYRERVNELAAVLETADPGAPVWNWTAAPQTA